MAMAMAMSAMAAPTPRRLSLLPRPTSSFRTAVATLQASSSSRVELAFTVGATVIPHPDKVEKGGEDAYFVSTFGGGVLGIADGVSGWAEQNVDPALFSKEFMAHAEAAVASEEMDIDAQLLLQKAHTSTSSVGAATAIVAILERNGNLHVANVGDCGLRILRQGRIVFATKPQQHYFDCPYQFSSEKGGQSAADAAVFRAELKEGDTIVMGSDGLFDNVYDLEIESTLRIFTISDQESAQCCANALAALASKNSRDTTYESPYSKEAIQQGLDLPWYKKVLGQKLTGGKLDDITVIVGHVVYEQSPKETTVEERIPTVSVGDLGVPGRVDEEQLSSVPSVADLGVPGRADEEELSSVPSVGDLGVPGRADEEQLSSVPSVEDLGVPGRADEEQLSSVPSVGDLGVQGRADEDQLSSVPSVGDLGVPGRADEDQLSSVPSVGDLGVPGRADEEQLSSVPETFPEGLSEGWA